MIKLIKLMLKDKDISVIYISTLIFVMWIAYSSIQYFSKVGF